MRINVGEYFNKLIEKETSLVELQEKLQSATDDDYVLMSDIRELADTIPIDYTMDVALHIIAGYLNDIAQRAVELKDEKLLELLSGLGCVTKTE